MTNRFFEVIKDNGRARVDQKNQLDSLYIENENKRNGDADFENWIKLDNVRKIDAKKLI